MKMKRALVLGASALIILALNQNTVSEVNLHTLNIQPGPFFLDPKLRLKMKAHKTLVVYL